jgi:hypothetical protein
VSVSAIPLGTQAVLHSPFSISSDLSCVFIVSCAFSNSANLTFVSFNALSLSFKSVFNLRTSVIRSLPIACARVKLDMLDGSPPGVAAPTLEGVLA